MIRAVDENQVRREKALKRRGNGNMKKSRKRRLEAAEQKRQANLETNELEFQIQNLEEQLENEKNAYYVCENQLELFRRDASRLKENALDLQEQLKKLYHVCNQVEADARKTVTEMENHEEKILELSEQLVELNKQYSMMTALHFTLEEVCISETCKRVYWNTDVHKQEVQKILLELMTDVSKYPKDFQELIGIANRQEICRIAEALAYHKQLTAQYPGKAIVWHFTKRDNVYDLLEFAGLKISEG